MINGAPTFLTLADSHDRPHEVTLRLPSAWTRSTTALPPIAGEAHAFRATSYDRLVDSPILLGSPAVYDFELEGRMHRLVNEGEAGVFDGARAARDFESIAREHHRFWGTVPYSSYVCLNLITESVGGLEHCDSAVLMTSRWATRTRKAYLGWLELASHELFHVWNGKRLRPVALGPFDYEREAHTRSLWVVEGITDYYGDLLLHRAGLSTRDEFLASLSDKIETLQTTPGRAVHPIVTASFDAWIKFYRQDENSPNTSISYYIKGSVVAFLLDARIRRVSSDKRSLDDVMRAAYAKYSANVGIRSRSFERSSKMSPERASNRSGHWHSKAPPNSITPMRSMRSDFDSRSPNQMTGRHREKPRSVRSRRSMAAGLSCRRSDAERLRTKRASTWTMRFSRSMTSEFDPINSMREWSSISPEIACRSLLRDAID